MIRRRPSCGVSPAPASAPWPSSACARATSSPRTSVATPYSSGLYLRGVRTRRAHMERAVAPGRRARAEWCLAGSVEVVCGEARAGLLVRAFGDEHQVVIEVHARYVAIEVAGLVATARDLLIVHGVGERLQEAKHRLRAVELVAVAA